MPNTAPLQLAVIGSGPAGCYLTQAILRALPQAEVTVFDRLPSPYGLVRYGIAADHQHTKSITRQFERLFADPRVRFAGNVTVGSGEGSDIGDAELRAAFDAVVLASGLAGDRTLDVPGAALPGVHGSGTLTRVLNSHPGERPALPELGSDVVIVGGGNVAIDILRFLVKDREGYAASDIADHALDAYLAHPADRIALLNRSKAARAKSDPQMLKELAVLTRAHYSAPNFDPDAEAATAVEDRTAASRIAAFAELTGRERPSHPGPQVTIQFDAVPVKILGSDRVEAVEFTVGDAAVQIPATSVITAIGFTPADELLTGLLTEHGAPEHAQTGRISAGLYRTGWAKRGPRGAIPENRACAKEVADEILADLESGALSAGNAPGYSALPSELRAQAISYDNWLNLERHEREAAGPDRIRRKLTDTRAMIDIARTDSPTGRNPQL